jgi:hypothetical protein
MMKRPRRGRISMSVWLYQMSHRDWPPERYREEVWEGELSSWPAGKVIGGTNPEPGDSMVLWYARTGNPDPGMYGWGVVVGTSAIQRRKRIRWRPVTPSDYLKMNPLLDDETAAIVDQVRKGMPRATMWPIPHKHMRTIRERIAAHLTPGSSPERL